MKKLRYILLFIMAFFVVGNTLGDDGELKKEVRRYVRKGNKLYHAGKHNEATVQYQKAFALDSLSSLVAYNLATSMFPAEWKIMKPDAKRDSVMIMHFMTAADTINEANPKRRAMAYHNIGVMHQVRANQTGDQQKYQELRQAIEAYKMALRNNPLDDETRYNLVLCMRQLPKGDGGNGDNNNENGDQDKQDQDKQDQDKQDQDQQEQQEQQQEQQDQQQQAQPQDQQNTPDKDWIEQMLNAADQKEKQTRRRLDEQQQNRSPRQRLEKNW